MDETSEIAKVLIVDDDEGLLETITDLLTDFGYHCWAAASAQGGLDQLAAEPCEVMLADIRMPGTSGLSLLKDVKSGFPEVDVIMMTAFDMDYSYVDVIEAGAADFIVKPFRPDELQAKIKRILHERHLKRELYRLSIFDSLTGLFNRRHLFQKLDQELTRAHRHQRELALIIIDVDNFKQHNDLFGHLGGDSALVTLAEIINRSIRNQIDSAFRYGGDEFAVLLVEAGLVEAELVAERIRKQFAAAGFVSCTLSLGITVRGEGDCGEDLLRRADEAMYTAKRAGGNRVSTDLGPDLSVPSQQVQ